MKKVFLLLVACYSLGIMAQKNIYICLHGNYHAVSLDDQENIAPSVASHSLHVGLNLRYDIEDIDSIVFIRPSHLQGFRVGWEQLVPQQEFQYCLPPLNSKTALYEIKKTDNSIIPGFDVNLLINFNDPESLQKFASQYAKRTKNWKLTMRTLTKGRRIPAYNHFVTSGNEGISQESDENLNVAYSDLFKDKSLEDIHKALYYWQNFTPDTEPPLTSADSAALPGLPIFGTMEHYDDFKKIRYQLELPQKGLTCVVTSITEAQDIKGYTMTLTFDENGEEYRGEAYEAYLSLQDDEDEFFHVQLDDNRLTISSFFHETDEAGNLYPAPISYDYYLQRLVMLDLEWNRPLAYDLLNQ